MLSYGVRMSHYQKPYTGYTRPYSRLKFCHTIVSGYATSHISQLCLHYLTQHAVAQSLVRQFVLCRWDLCKVWHQRVVQIKLWYHDSDMAVRQCGGFSQCGGFHNVLLNFCKWPYLGTVQIQCHWMTYMFHVLL